MKAASGFAVMIESIILFGSKLVTKYCRGEELYSPTIEIDSGHALARKSTASSNPTSAAIDIGVIITLSTLVNHYYNCYKLV